MTDLHLTSWRNLLAVAACATAWLVGCGSADRTASGPQYALRESEYLAHDPGVSSHRDAPRSGEESESSSPAMPGVGEHVEVEPWRFGVFPGQVIESLHYQIHTTIDRDWARDDLPRFVEAALEQYTTVFGDLPKPTRKFETYMFATREQWQEKAAELLPGQAAAYRNLGRGGLSTAGIAVLYYIDYYGRPHDTFAITAHEGWHQYTQTTFKHQLPVWIEEGIAAYMEGFHTDSDGRFIFDAARNYERRRTLRSAVAEEKLISLQDMLNRAPATFLAAGKEQLLVYYAQGWAMCRFLVEGENGAYAQAFHQLLQDAAEGRLVGELLEFSPRSVSLRRASLAAAGSGDTVIKVYFNTDVTEFEQQYRAFVKQILQEPMLIRPRSHTRSVEVP